METPSSPSPPERRTTTALPLAPLVTSIRPATSSKPKRRSTLPPLVPPTPPPRPRSPPQLYSQNPYGDEEDQGSVNQIVKEGFNKLMDGFKKTFGPTSSTSTTPNLAGGGASGGSSPVGGGGSYLDGLVSSSSRSRVDSAGSASSSYKGALAGGGGRASPASAMDDGNRSLRSLGTVSEGSEGAVSAGRGSIPIRGLMGPPPPRTAAQRLAAHSIAQDPPSSSTSSSSPSSRPPPNHHLKIVPVPHSSNLSHSRPSSSSSKPLSAAPPPPHLRSSLSSGSSSPRPRPPRPPPTFSTRFSSSAAKPSSAAPVTSFDPAAGQTISSHSKDQQLPLSSSTGSLSNSISNLNFDPFSPTTPLSYSRPRHSSLTGSFSSPSAPSVMNRSSPFLINHNGNNRNSGGSSSFSFAVPDSPGGGSMMDDDARSVRSFGAGVSSWAGVGTGGVRPRTESASRVIRRITGEALTKEFWMADESAKVCYDCHSAFTAWRRKHHCRICGQIFCVRCASNIIKGNRFGTDGNLRVCNLCVKIMDEYDDDDDDRRSINSVATGIFPMAPSIQLDPPFNDHSSAPPYSPFSPFTPSPFLSQSFGRTLDLATLGSISETTSLRRRGSIEDESSRPLTPDAQFQLYMGVGQGRPDRVVSEGSSNDTGWGGGGGGGGDQFRTASNPAPFRRAIGADDDDQGGPSTTVDEELEGDGSTPISSTEQSPNLSEGGGGGGVDKENQRPFVSFPKSTTTPSTSIAPFEPRRPQLKQLGESTISFPSSSGEDQTPDMSIDDLGGGGSSQGGAGGGLPPFRSRLSSRFDSNAPLPPAGLMRTRLESRFSMSTLTLNEMVGEASANGNGSGGGGRPRASSLSAPSQEISGASMLHFRRMLRQAIKKSGIPNGRQWMETLAKLIVRASTSIQVNSQASEDQDIRNYVKVKKIPGGRIRDSEYIDGVVITKGFAHKAMPRHHISPRIMLLKFPLDYSRVQGQFVVLDAAVAQEADYLAKLVLRIVALRPHLVLVEQGVSRLALEGLHAAGISVAQYIPHNGLEALRRCTQADIIGEMGQLSRHPRIGRCADVRVQTFDHELIPGRRKTLMRFEGCPPEFGCTIILRGGNMETLRKVKEIADFMVFVAYHLKLEMMLWYDEFNISPPPPPIITLPEMPTFSTPEASSSTPSSPVDETHSSSVATSHHGNANTRRRAHDERILSKRIYDSLLPYHETILSMSTSVRFPPPYPISKMSSIDLSLHDLRSARDEEEAALILREEKEIASISSQVSSPNLEQSDPVAVLGLFAPSDDPIIPETQHLQQHQQREDLATPTGAESFPLPPETPSEGGPPSLPLSTPTSTPTPNLAPSPIILAIARQPLPSLIPPLPTLQSMLHRQEDVHRISALDQVEFEHAAQLNIFEWFTGAYRHNLEPKDKQGLIYLAASGKNVNDVHHQCVPAHFRRATYYQKGEDMTLGQWILQKAESASQKCLNKTCNLPNVAHYEVLVHRETRLQVAMELHSGFKARDPDQITTWSFCTLCNESTAPWYLSELTLKISFGKFLERAFHPDPDRKPIGKCPHDYVRNHIRLFIRRNLTIRIHNEPVDNFEIFLPTTRPYVRAETKLLLKNQEITSSFQKSTAYWDSVAARLKSFDVDVVDPTKMDKLRLALADLLDRLEDDRREFLMALAEAAKKSAVTDVLGVNQVLVHLLTKVEQWDDTFAELEKAFIPSDKDLRRLTEKKIRRLFANDFGSERGMTPISSTVSEVDEEKDEKDTSVADGSSQYEGDSVDGESVSNDSESILSDDASQEGLTPSILSTFSTIDSNVTEEAEATLPSSTLAPHLVETGSPTTESNLSTPLATTGLPPSSHHPHHHHHHLGITSSPPSYFGQHHVPITSHDPNDSDSTISGLPSTLRPLPPLESPPALPLPSPVLSTSHDQGEDAPERSSSPFVSRIPRRARQSNAIAGLMKKFEEVDNDEEDEEEESAPNSPFVPHPKPIRHADAIFSESEQEHQPSLSASRPRIRRGRTEGTSIRVRQPPTGILSDGEPGYAAHASSRIPISASLKPPPESANLRRAGSGSRSRSGSSGGQPSGSRSVSPTPASPNRALRSLRPVGLGIQASSSSSSSTRPMTLGAGPVRTGSIRASKGKGKLPARLNPSTHVPTAGSRRGPVPGGLSGKVSSYARHFDGLSRDADRARQKSITAAKGKRARPVAVTRVTVRTLDLRSAVKDDSDSSDSSEADDEDDGEEESRKKGRQEGTSPHPSDQSSPPQPDQDQVAFPLPSSDDKDPLTLPSTSPSTDSSIPVVDKAAPKERRPSTLQLPVPGRVRDLVELDLEKFDTKAPLPSLPPTPQYPAESFSVSQSLAGHLSESEMSSAGPERQSILKTLSGLWAFRTGDFSPIAYPFGAGVHFFRDSRVIMRDDEPTSIVAFTLSSTKYKDTVRVKKQAHAAEATELGRGEETEWSIVGRTEAMEYDERPTEIHAQFDYEPAPGVNIFCRVFFLDEFESLRRRCGLDVEGGFIESLARCVKWESSGGKSGSAFLKTKDDRFIAKELSRIEMDALTTFAPAYFKYMNECLDENRPTALAKIFGVYKLGYKSPSRTMRMNVMVMENLFYERKCHVIYDLKGNTRNRHVDPTGKAGEVLLDANLEKSMWTNPIYLREYSKRILKGSLANDTKFLADMQIMDYSLVVGIDLVRAELVVGVVDYIRTFTWDKKIEQLVKESAFFPGGGKGQEPTIVTPKQYKNRFRSAMNRYFTLTPDPWMSKTSLESLGEEIYTGSAYEGLDTAEMGKEKEKVEK